MLHSRLNSKVTNLHAWCSYFLAWSEIKSQLPFGVFDGVNLLICTIMYSFNLLIWFRHLGRKTYSCFLKKFVNFHSVTVAVLLRCSPLLDHSFVVPFLHHHPRQELLFLWSDDVKKINNWIWDPILSFSMNHVMQDYMTNSWFMVGVYFFSSCAWNIWGIICNLVNVPGVYGTNTWKFEHVSGTLVTWSHN